MKHNSRQYKQCLIIMLATCLRHVSSMFITGTRHEHNNSGALGYDNRIGNRFKTCYHHDQMSSIQ